MTKHSENTQKATCDNAVLANRLLKFRFWGNFGELNEEEDVCEMEMLYGDKFCFFENEPINDLFACRNFQVMQFTGLKDIEGKEIYEGDIILGYKNPHVVTFADGAFYLTYRNSSVRLSRTCGALKIIGNIFENPDLTQTTS